ncbi:MAG: response regulator [Propionibacteriaceae bacterium]
MSELESTRSATSAERRPPQTGGSGATDAVADQSHDQGHDQAHDQVRGHEEPTAEPRTATVLLYSDDRTVRQSVRFALGRRVARDLPELRVVEVATQPAVVTTMDAGGVDLAILDGEAVPGGMGVCRGLKDELDDCPPILVLTGRPDDAWLATWSRADGALPHPIDPVRLPETVAALLRARLGTPTSA